MLSFRLVYYILDLPIPTAGPTDSYLAVPNQNPLQSVHTVLVFLQERCST